MGAAPRREALAPLIYATAAPEALQQTQRQYGSAASEAVEALFAELVVQLYQLGFSRFIVAGGETSGVVTQALGIRGFHIGPSISPGVPLGARQRPDHFTGIEVRQFWR